MHPESAVRYHYLTYKLHTFYLLFSSEFRGVDFQEVFCSQCEIVTVYYLRLRYINSLEY